jgi:hypothetical protein
MMDAVTGGLRRGRRPREPTMTPSTVDEGCTRTGCFRERWNMMPSSILFEGIIWLG